MKHMLAATYALGLLATALAASPVSAQAGDSSIDGVTKVDESDQELRVRVDYTYAGEYGTLPAYIHAFPEEGPRGHGIDVIEFDRTNKRVRLGENHAILRIERVLGAEDALSTAVGVCMYQNHRRPTGAFLCDEFSLIKAWSKPPESRGTCTIFGHISGQIKWNVLDDRGQQLQLTVDHIYMTTPGVVQPVVTRVYGRTFEFLGVEAGRDYTVVLGNFEAEPPSKVVSCSANGRYRVNFRITGPGRYTG